jgi:catechol 2,3-dioxygenase-like lactoylglutathione lyase family enzyme
VAVSLGESFIAKPVGQIGIVVRDLDAAVEQASAHFASGPWRIFTYSGETMTESTYKGQPGTFSVRIALNAQTPMIEFLQPLEGPSVYHDWLESHGEGLHHLAFWVDSLDAAISEMDHAGFGLLQSGRGYGTNGDGGFAYFDTERAFGVIYEAIEAPSVRRDPERVAP